MTSGESVIVTFYSYKGGVGRSMAVANVACILARDYGKSVLVVDWDLEAPGLHRFFGLDSRSLRPGLIDILEDYKALLSKDIDKLPKQLVSLDRYVNTEGMPTYRDSGGSVALIGAGRQDEKYAGRVNGFSWDDFYKKWHGFGFIEYLKGELKQKADVVLLDSRTGVTDIGGICTLQLPDVVVLMFALNDQNIAGVESIARSIRERAAEVAQRETPPEIIVRPSRVEIYLEENLLKKWQGIAADRLGKYLLPGDGEPLRYMAKRGIPYIGAYSFGETLAVSSNELGPLAESYESLAASVMKAAGLAGDGSSATATSHSGLPGDWPRKIRSAYAAFVSSRRALRVALLVSLLMFATLFFMAAENYARLKVIRQQAENERRQAEHTRQQAAALSQAVRDAETRLSELRLSLTQNPGIDYCPKNDDEAQKIEAALADVGFVMRKIPPRNDVPVNSVYFGPSVNPEDVRKVALKLLQGGIQIKGIYRFENTAPKRDGTPRTTLIEVVASRTNATRPALTEDDIINMKQFQTFAAQTP
ncbi:MAG TPA: hypothetical protein VF591_19175 [Pyrinomonadaceae bacterium]|jgi:cellulose biosynthesis protein BcsQ